MAPGTWSWRGHPAPSTTDPRARATLTGTDDTIPRYPKRWFQAAPPWAPVLVIVSGSSDWPPHQPRNGHPPGQEPPAGQTIAGQPVEAGPGRTRLTAYQDKAPSVSLVHLQTDNMTTCREGPRPLRGPAPHVRIHGPGAGRRGHAQPSPPLKREGGKKYAAQGEAAGSLLGTVLVPPLLATPRNSTRLSATPCPLAASA